MKVMVDGMEAHAATGGVAPSGDGPIMVLLHGAGGDATAWQLQTRYLAHHGVRPLAIDLPGHGRSAGDPRPTIGDLAHWVTMFLDAVDLDGTQAVHVAGHSMGSFIGLELAASHQERVASLTLLGTAGAMPVHPDLIQASADDLPAAAALMASWGHGPPAQIGPNPTPGLWMLGGARALVEVSHPGALTTDFEACATYQGAADAAARLACPVRMVIGLADKMTPARAAAALAAEIPAGLLSTIELPGAGHMLMSEVPGQVRQVLLAAATDSPS